MLPETRDSMDRTRSHPVMSVLHNVKQVGENAGARCWNRPRNSEYISMADVLVETEKFDAPGILAGRRLLPRARKGLVAYVTC